jgi:hypothetical protein
MNFRLIAATLAAGVALNSAGWAQDGLYRAEKKAYHACLYARYIGDYCRFHAWGYNRQSFADCVIANGACGCSLANGGYWGPYIDEACRALAPGRRL